MSNLVLDRPGRAARAASSSDLYRAVWRWHFYAGLFVLPFLVSLSITGGLYLFRDEIDAIVHADVKRVVAAEGATRASPSTMVAAALAAHPGTAVKYTDPVDAGTSAEVTVREGSGERLAVYINPYDASVLGALPDRGTIMWTIRQLHSLKFFGPVARGRSRSRPAGRSCWSSPASFSGGRGAERRRRLGARNADAPGLLARHACRHRHRRGRVPRLPRGDRHALVAGLGRTGERLGERLELRLPVRRARRRSDVGGQAQPGGPDKLVDGTGGRAHVAPRPQAPIGLDAAVGTFEALGLHRASRSTFPPPPPASTRVGLPGRRRRAARRASRPVHRQAADRHGYADYGPLGRAWNGGSASISDNSSASPTRSCFSWFASATSFWPCRRRDVVEAPPIRSMGVPPMPKDPRVLRGLLVLLAIGGVLFPLVGASLIVMLAIDFLVRRLTRPLTA